MDRARANAKPDKGCLKAIINLAKLSLIEALAVLQRDPQARALFESPELLEQLPIPNQTKALVRVLRDPGTGAVVYLIGTCHVSKASADDVQMLVETVRPDMVAIELDRISFGVYLSGQLPLLAADPCPSTTRGVLRFLWHPDYGLSFSTLWNAYYPIFESQCLGVPYPSDVLSALRSVKNTPEVKRIQCMDRPSLVTQAKMDGEMGFLRSIYTQEVLAFPQGRLNARLRPEPGV